MSEEENNDSTVVRVTVRMPQATYDKMIRDVDRIKRVLPKYSNNDYIIACVERGPDPKSPLPKDQMEMLRGLFGEEKHKTYRRMKAGKL